MKHLTAPRTRGFALGLCSLMALACEDGSSERDESAPESSATVTGSAPPSNTASAQPTAMATPNGPAAPQPTAGSGMTPVEEMLLDAGTDAGAAEPPAEVEPGPTCEIASVRPFNRSDTEEIWDDNDFSDVIVSGYCPVLLDVTWPHEEGWENADPSNADHEQTHFTMDSYSSGDLTGKQLNLTIELTADQRGPNATGGGYIVSLVSVSRYTMEVPVEPVDTEVGLGDAGFGDGGLNDPGFGDASVLADPAEAGALLDAANTLASWDAAADGGALLDAAPELPMTVTQTGYSEAESAPEDRVILRHVGDRATIVFPLPNKTEEIDSYDPTTVIKINFRVYNMYPVDESVPEQADDILDGGMSVFDGGAEAGSIAAAEGGVSPAGLTDAGVLMSSADASVMGSDAGVTVTGELELAPDGKIYEYVSSQFAISKFTITDVGSL